MHRIKKLMIQTLLIVLLSFSATAYIGAEHFAITAEAAVKAPTVKNNKKTLYAGYTTSKVEFNNLSSKAKVTYKSSNSKVAKVSKYGTITPITAGMATVTVTVSQNSRTYNLKVAVTVKNPYINITTKTDYLNVDDSFNFKAKVYGMKNKVAWSVSDEEIATISDSGKLTAVSTGYVTVFADAGGKTAEYQVGVGSNRIKTLIKKVTVYEKATLHFTVDELKEGEKLLSSAGSKTSDIFNFQWDDDERDGKFSGTLKPLGTGKDTLVISSNKTPDLLVIEINIIKTPEPLSAKEIYKKCGSATVEITSSSPLYGDSLGSGFFISDGVIVTNYHVIEGADKIKVKTQDNTIYDVKTIIGYNGNLDLAILSIESKNESLSISQSKVVVGEDIYALGSPLGLTQTLSDGIVTTASRIIDEVDYIQINASISPGNSGGPLLNAYGDVIGVNTMYYENGQNLNFAINIRELEKIDTSFRLPVELYFALYQKKVEEEFLKNMIYEDPTISQSPSTCQYADAYHGIAGKLTPGEKGDFYYFQVNKPIKIYVIIKSENMEDVKNTYLELYEYSGKYYTTAQEAEGELNQYLYYSYLLPGDYLLLVSPDIPVTDEVPYIFIVSYDAA